MNADYFINEDSNLQSRSASKSYIPTAADKDKMERLIGEVNNYHSCSSNFRGSQDLLMARNNKSTQEILDTAIEYQDWVLKLPIDKQIYIVFGWNLSKNMLQLNNLAVEENAEYWK